MNLSSRTRYAISVVLVACVPAAAGEEVTFARRGTVAVLSVHTFRPMDAVAKALAQFGIEAGAEDPRFRFRGDLMDISTEVERVRPGTLVPARWGFEVEFRIDASGMPLDRAELMRSIVQAANAHSPYRYRLDEENGTYQFVPEGTRDAQGRSVAETPILDLPVSFQAAIRPVNESARLLAQDLSRTTGLRISCCQSFVTGVPWGMEQRWVGAEREPARSVLKRLGLKTWHMRCDPEWCFIELH